MKAAIGTVINRIRPQVLTAMILIGAISGFLVFVSAVEAAVGLGGSLALLSKEVIASDEKQAK